MGKREKTPESEAMIWLLSAIVKGRKGGVHRQRERKREYLTWPKSTLVSISFFFFHHFLRHLPTHNYYPANKQLRKGDSKQRMKLQKTKYNITFSVSL